MIEHILQTEAYFTREKSRINSFKLFALLDIIIIFLTKRGKDCDYKW